MASADFDLSNKGLICPVCKHMLLEVREEGAERVVYCESCGEQYPLFNGVPLMLPRELDKPEVKQDIQSFWQGLYHAAYGNHEQTESDFPDALNKLKAMFVARQHLAVVEMPIDALAGKKVLEIGSGAGAHSSLFCSLGAHVTSLDLTLDRVLSTKQKLEVLDKKGTSFVVQGDAEVLPFEDDFFDIVYSNGVLHHTPDTGRSIQEVYRVVKPGGKAVIMLYAKHSYLYWINIFLLRGVLSGNIFRYSNWLGRVTEWMSTKNQHVYNPETKVYSRKEVVDLFHMFGDIQVRKSSFVFQQIPFFGVLISNILSRYSIINPAGKLVYDHAWRHETKLELWLGKYIGFNLNIRATK